MALKKERNWLNLMLNKNLVLYRKNPNYVWKEVSNIPKGSGELRVKGKVVKIRR